MFLTFYVKENERSGLPSYSMGYMLPIGTSCFKKSSFTFGGGVWDENMYISKEFFV